MKKIFVILMFLFIITALSVFADDDSGYGNGIENSMQYTNSVENAFSGQKPVTDEEYQKALEKVKARQKKGKKKQFKGKSFGEENNNSYLDEMAEKNLLLSVPLSLINGDGTEIPAGHYKIMGKKANDKIFLDFYQSSTLVAHVPAIETQSDFDQSAVNFVKILPYDSQRIKVIYGSIDFNAYTFIRIKNEISDLN